MNKQFARFKRNPPQGLKLATKFWVECVDITQNPFNESSIPTHIVFKPNVIAPMPMNHVIVESMIGSEIEFTTNIEMVREDNVESARKLLEQHKEWKVRTADKLSFAVTSDVDSIDDVEFIKAFNSHSAQAPFLSSESDYKLTKEMIEDPLMEGR